MFRYRLGNGDTTGVNMIFDTRFIVSQLLTAQIDVGRTLLICFCVCVTKKIITSLGVIWPQDFSSPFGYASGTYAL